MIHANWKTKYNLLLITSCSTFVKLINFGLPKYLQVFSFIMAISLSVFYYILTLAFLVSNLQISLLLRYHFLSITLFISFFPLFQCFGILVLQYVFTCPIFAQWKHSDFINGEFLLGCWLRVLTFTRVLAFTRRAYVFFFPPNLRVIYTIILYTLYRYSISHMFHMGPIPMFHFPYYVLNLLLFHIFLHVLLGYKLVLFQLRENSC